MEAATQPTAPVKRRRREETRQRLLKAAFGVFARNGYDRSTVDEIVRDAGYSKGAFYVHFDSKEDLFWAMLDERASRHQGAFLRALDEDSTVRDNVRALLTAIFALEKEEATWPAVFMEFVAHAGRNPAVRERLANVYQGWREFIAQILRAGQNAGQIKSDIDVQFATSAAIALIEGTIIQSRLAPEAIDLDELIDPLCDLLVDILGR